MGRIGCPETSVENYHYMLRNFTERRSMNSVCTVTVSWPNRDRIVTEPWPIVTVSWSYSDHTVTVSWPYRDRIVTEPWSNRDLSWPERDR